MWTLDLIREAAAAGAEAYKNGAAQHHCPYCHRYEGAQAIAWERAWLEAQASSKCSAA